MMSAACSPQGWFASLESAFYIETNERWVTEYACTGRQP